MNRVRKAPLDFGNLIPESCFMDYQRYNSKEVKEHIVDKQAHDLTIRALLHDAIKEHKRRK